MHGQTHIKCLVVCLSDTNRTLFFTTDFNRSPEYNISRTSVEWELTVFHSDGRTYRQDEDNMRFPILLECD